MLFELPINSSPRRRISLEIKAKRKAKVLIALIMALPAVASLVAILIIGALYF